MIPRWKRNDFAVIVTIPIARLARVYCAFTYHVLNVQYADELRDYSVTRNRTILSFY